MKHKLQGFIAANGPSIWFSRNRHSVEEAEATASTPEDFVKNICMVNRQGNLIVAIAKGEGRVSTSRVGGALNIEPPRKSLKKRGTLWGSAFFWV